MREKYASAFNEYGFLPRIYSRNPRIREDAAERWKSRCFTSKQTIRYAYSLEKSLRTKTMILGKDRWIRRAVTNVLLRPSRILHIHFSFLFVLSLCVRYLCFMEFWKSNLRLIHVHFFLSFFFWRGAGTRLKFWNRISVFFFFSLFKKHLHVAGPRDSWHTGWNSMFRDRVFGTQFRWTPRRVVKRARVQYFIFLAGTKLSTNLHSVSNSSNRSSELERL